MNHLNKLFKDREVCAKIKSRMPHIFQIAELDASRGGKLGMEVGSVREKVIIALLMYKFGQDNVDPDIPITDPEKDAILYNKEPVSIKTMSGKRPGCFKLIWTVDAQKAEQFLKNYRPSCDILFAHINWDSKGGFYMFPLASQKDVFDKLGRTKYIKLPKVGTNPRGVEITQEAVDLLVNHKDTKKIEIDWKREAITHNIYARWLDHWEEA